MEVFLRHLKWFSGNIDFLFLALYSIQYFWVFLNRCSLYHCLFTLLLCMCVMASTTPRTNGGVRFDTLERKRRFVIGLYNFISHLELLFLLDRRILSLHCFSFVLSLMVVIYILGEIYFTPNPKYIQNCCIYENMFFSLSIICLYCVMFVITIENLEKYHKN